MPYAVPFGQTLTRLRAPAPGRHGAPSGPVAELDFPGCVVWPTDGNGSGGNERTDRQNTVVWGYTVMFADPDADVRPADQWRYLGGIFEQVGEAGRYLNPQVGTRVLTIVIRRVTG